MAPPHDEPVEVLRRDDAPAQFLLNSRLYVVREVLAHWAATARAGAQRERWRVEAAAGRDAGVGVFDLCWSGRQPGWTASLVEE